MDPMRIPSGVDESGMDQDDPGEKAKERPLEKETFSRVNIFSHSSFCLPQLFRTRATSSHGGDMILDDRVRYPISFHSSWNHLGEIAILATVPIRLRISVVTTRPSTGLNSDRFTANYASVQRSIRHSVLPFFFVEGNTVRASKVLASQKTTPPK